MPESCLDRTEIVSCVPDVFGECASEVVNAQPGADPWLGFENGCLVKRGFGPGFCPG